MSLLGAAGLAATLAAVPAMARLEGNRLSGWCTLAATALLPIVFLTWMVRGAGVGLRPLRGESWRPLWFRVFVGALCLGGYLSVAGKVLRQSAHHFPLAGTTLAITAAVVAVLLVPVTGRIAQSFFRAWKEGNMAPAIAGAVALGLLGLQTMNWIGTLKHSDNPGVAPFLVDTLAWAVAAMLASRDEFRAPRWVWAGVPIALLVVVVGLAAPGATGVFAPSPLYSAILGLFFQRPMH